MTHHPLVPRVPESAQARVCTWLIGMYAVVQGTGIMCGGPARWHSLALSVVVKIPGSVGTWGIPLLMAGVLTLTGTVFKVWGLKAVGLAMISIWSFAFSAGVATTMLSIHSVTTTAAPIHFLVCCWAATLITIDDSHPALTADQQREVEMD